MSDVKVETINVKRTLTQHLELVPYDKLTGDEVCVWGDYYKAPTTGTTGVLTDGPTRYKYDFGKGEVVLLDIQDNEVFRKAVPLHVFAVKQYAWLSLIKREARLVLNLDEEVEGVEAVCEEEDGRQYFGYIDEEGDVIDMTNADESGEGAVLMTLEELEEKFGNSYELDEEANIYILNEAQLPKTSDPEEGKVYWNKKHDQAFYVVAVYPDEEEKKQVSYWNDEGVRKTCSIEDFKKNMVPSKDVEDYDIFEECDKSLDEGALAVEPTAVNGKTFTVHINGKKYSYFPTEESGLTAKDLKKKYDGIAKHSIGKALAWLKKNATTNDSYGKVKEEKSLDQETREAVNFLKKKLKKGTEISYFEEGIVEVFTENDSKDLMSAIKEMSRKFETVRIGDTEEIDEDETAYYIYLY